MLSNTTEEIQKGIAEAKTIAGRTNLIKANGYNVIDDCYNANPNSMSASHRSLSALSGRRVAVLGDMKELTDSAALHANIGVLAADLGIDMLFTVGEDAETMYDIIDTVEPHMPCDKPRYLMGVGTPQNIVEAVHRGVDFFDCVMPSRNARHGNLFTWEGKINIVNEKYAEDPRPISPSCNCPSCKRYSRSYIRHLFKAKEALGMRLAVLHNLYFYNELMQKIRDALDEDRYEEFYQQYRFKLAERVSD